jgi:stage II sporulation protein D
MCDMVRLVLLAVVLCPLAGARASETMRIAVGPEAARVVVEGEALRFAEDADDGHYTPLERPRAVVSLEKGHLLLDGAPVVQESLRFRAGSVDEAPITVNEAHVRGDVVVVPGRAGLVAVNVLPLESYLAGVLGSEMPRSFPLEALKAQAVAARTYALNKKLEQYGQPFHLGSSVISQVYKGLDAEDPRTHEAVQATRGLVLTFDLQPIEAYFHASCGGRTESGLEALGRDLPYLQAVECSCGALPTTRWSMKVTAKELGALAGAAKASALSVLGRSPTGRARKVQVGGRTWDAVSFREKLGYMRLKSLKFEVEKSHDGWTLEGKGFGHGAGLCQWGAKQYAEAGWDFRRILSHYYPGTELQVLY